MERPLHPDEPARPLEHRPAVGDERAPTRSATPIVAAMVALAVAAVAYMAFGMPGMDHSTATSSMDMSGHRGHRLMAPPAFEAAMSQPGTIIINVHVPADEVSLQGTTLEMPFDAIDPAALPADRSTPLAVYCRSGSMSADAVATLSELGYTNIAELDGGTVAWVDSGRSMDGS
jgi:rhodanese-related sulfurtransferase